ncbi:iron complex transport system substrate-binding protein [Amycolatopsis bartoniae]|uniref:ABC transporter substrate-binding protein n=1 Tax=Amycolatopsis bartoniae TaxID=941986 RepID=A0A8H9MFV3_9PSEU|nr:helical backbone metal receptor [Amycolatopsis bartoniae]MBB2934005.1 iron complex transport system substrate-binding protein [Amycolatopsis bartoniae]GHF85961.1 ABC transporter substrate-binding protein [Amycolatopsis bartoniae]
MTRRFPLLLVVLLVLAGCASHQQDEASPAKPDTEAVFPVTIGSVTIDSQPARIVSLSPSATETLFALGAGAQVVAVDSQSDYPPQAPHTALSALSPDPEAIAGYHPDLVVTSADTNGLSAALAKTGTKTLVMPDAKTLDDAYAEFLDLGRATGHQAEGESLARQTRSDIDQVIAATPKPARPLSFYWELDQTYYSVTSKTFLGQVLARFGLTNIADGTDPAANGGYPQLSAERILQSDPDVVFLADTKCCGQSAQTVAARPGWNTLTAVKEGHVFPLDDDLASRWSPRIVDLVRAISADVTDAGK